MKQPQFLPGNIVYLPYQQRGIMVTTVESVIVLADDDVEYYLQGWTGGHPAQGLYATFSEAFEALTPYLFKK